MKKTTKKKTAKKTTTPSQTLTIEPVVDNTPKQIVRPTPKKTHQWTKEEKVLYKQLEESFNTIANMTMVIEERTMDTKNIPNLTIGELHLIEMVNRYNNKPMTLIANKLHITVGAMTICLNRLVQKGYLLRTRDEMDRRVILLSITPEGKKVLKYHNKFQILYLQKRHKTEPHPPKSLFKSEDDENFSLYVSEVTFPLTDT